MTRQAASLSKLLAGTTEREIEIKGIAEAIGLDFDGYTSHRNAIDAMLTEANDGGELYVIWYGDVEDVVMGIANTEWGNNKAPTTISWKNPHLVILNTWNGSGFDSDAIPVTITKPFEREMFRLDGPHGHGYTWDQVAGVVHSAYECEVTIT